MSVVDGHDNDGLGQTECEAVYVRDLVIEAGATLAYGNFITLVINFLIVAWVLFLVIKAMNSLKREAEAAPPEAAAKPRNEELLEEIRDLLKKK